MDLDLPTIPRSARLKGDELLAFETKVCEAYDQNPKVGIREICEATGRSYGAIHRALQRGGVLRRRSGPRR